MTCDIMHTSCPLCKSALIRKVKEKHSYTLFACDSCNFLFVGEEFNLTEVYNSEYFNNYNNPASLFSPDKQEVGYAYGSISNNEDGHYSQAFSALAKFRNLSNASYLDIGCAYGSGLNVAKNIGMIPFGVDVSPSAIEHCCKRGFSQTYVGGVEAVRGLNFDVITMIDVLEHLVDPRSVLYEVRDSLKKGGLLYVKNNLFDFEKMQVDDVFFNRHFEPPYHCSYFSKPRFLRFFKEAGLQLVYSKPRYIAGLMNSYAQLKKMVNREFREMAIKNQSERLPPEQSKKFSTGSRLGKLVFRYFPAGFVFRKND